MSRFNLTSRIHHNFILDFLYLTDISKSEKIRIKIPLRIKIVTENTLILRGLSGTVHKALLFSFEISLTSSLLA